jgi:hypothetical protein
MVLHYDSYSHRACVVAGSQNADWYRNVQASPAVEIAIGRERYQPKQKFLQSHEIAMLLKWSRRHHPVTARVQSWFFGCGRPPMQKYLTSPTTGRSCLRRVKQCEAKW